MCECRCVYVLRVMCVVFDVCVMCMWCLVCVGFGVRAHVLVQMPVQPCTPARATSQRSTRARLGGSRTSPPPPCLCTAPPAGARQPLRCTSHSRRRFPGMHREGRAAAPLGGCSPRARKIALQAAVGTRSPGIPCAPPSGSAGRQPPSRSTGLRHGGVRCERRSGRSEGTMLASLAFCPLPQGLARLLRARRWWSLSRATYGTAAAAVAERAGAARPRLLPVLAARGRRELAPTPRARLPWRIAACRGRQRDLGGQLPVGGSVPVVPPLATPPGPTLPMGLGLGGSPVVNGPGLKGTTTAERPGLPLPGLAPLQTPRPSATGLASTGCLVQGTSSNLMASLREPTPWPSGAEQHCCHARHPGGHQSEAGSCSSGAGLPALIAVLAYCYLRDHLSKGDYHCWGWPRGGRSGTEDKVLCPLGGDVDPWGWNLPAGCDLECSPGKGLSLML